ncbi:hypothetical protein [Terrimonas sp.]|uniref:hypothetical protein n=1 Tax=Terrimonas sp. TaxID=1914338 RepID=UPI001056E943|nr:hypothetical protein [Terrimonas sp.]
MNIFFPLNHVFLVVGILSTLFLGDYPKKDIKKSNLLFIFPDQFRAQAMGFMKEDPVKTLQAFKNEE